MEDGQNDLNSIQQAFDFFQHFRQGHRPVQTDPTFVQQKEGLMTGLLYTVLCQ